MRSIAHRQTTGNSIALTNAGTGTFNYVWGPDAAGYCKCCSHIASDVHIEALGQRASTHFKVHRLFSNLDDAELYYITPRLTKDFGMYTQRSARGGNVKQPAMYKYEPIREGDDIRLLSLRPGKPGDIIRADLEIVSILGRRHCYDAISYTWADENGDATKCCSLEIGSPGVLLPITRNCDSVLRRVRRHTDRVWIDAVCIDQGNIRERGQQVDLMPWIYKGTVRTFAYAGEASGESGLVLRNLAEGIWTPPHLLGSFFARPYFSRVWVVQEVALSKSVTMMCGDTAVEWTGFMQGENMRQLYTSSYYETFPTLFRLGRQHHLGTATLLDALELGRSCDASDPRDKVFGLLGLVSEESRPLADYSLSTAEVYTKIAMYLLKARKRGLHVILGNICHRSHEAREQTQNLPSWVRDWNQRGPTFLQRVPQTQGFLAGEHPILEYNDETGLFLRGVILGTLDTLKEDTNISVTAIHLSNSRSRSIRALPPVYRDRRVYVFSTGLKSLGLPETQWPCGDRDDSDFVPRTPTDARFAFLVARINGGEASKSDHSEQREGESKVDLEVSGGTEDGRRPLATSAATTRKATTESCDGGVGANKFEFLGLVEILLNLALRRGIESLNSHVYQAPWMYTNEPCTVQIV